MDNIPELVALRLQEKYLAEILRHSPTVPWQTLYKDLQGHEETHEETLKHVQKLRDEGRPDEGYERGLVYLKQTIGQTQGGLLKALLNDIPHDEIRAELKRIRDREREIIAIEVERAIAREKEKAD